MITEEAARPSVERRERVIDPDGDGVTSSAADMRQVAYVAVKS
jgi:hypothetical protein